jgi:nucleotide-binding universal stress UspA family protein
VVFCPFVARRRAVFGNGRNQCGPDHHAGVSSPAHSDLDPATVIINSAQQSQIDLIVLATHGRTGMEAFWKGSVTHKICSRSRIPLLLIPVEKR